MSDIQIRSTGTTEVIQSSDGRITLSVPIQIKRRSGRKQMTLPNGQSGQPGKLAGRSPFPPRRGSLRA